MITSSSSTIRISAVLVIQSIYSCSVPAKGYSQYRCCSHKLHSFNRVLTEHPEVGLARVRKDTPAAATMRSRSVEEGADLETSVKTVSGAHRAHLRHRPQLGRRLRARDLRDVGRRRHGQGRGGAHKLLRPGRAGGWRQPCRVVEVWDPWDIEGTLAHNGAMPPSGAGGPRQRHARPRGQEARRAGLPFARARQTRTRLGLHPGHSRQGDDRRPMRGGCGSTRY